MKRLLIVAAFVATAACASGCNSCRPRLINWSFFTGESESCAYAAPCGSEMGGMSGGCTSGCSSGMGYEGGGVLLPAPAPSGTTRILPGPAEVLPPNR